MNDKLLTEGNYCFDFSKSISAAKADSNTFWGLLAVDFIVELSDKYLFVEIKDFNNPKTSEEYKINFLEQLRIDKKKVKEKIPFLFRMGVKFKDTVLHKWANEENLDKPIEYIVLLQFSYIDASERARFSESLFSGYLPTCITKKHGYKKILKICKAMVLNFEEWKEKYPQFPIISRLE